ncbi:MAG: nickel-responsive transcriptional regulator NikR [Thermodesulfobacteriota bacterium]|nr:nickel-responsive transcriptional regulator NikR [Thermodesulfobacteriota bacterium]
MGDVARFGVSLNKSLLKRFDDLIAKKKYVNRSEAIRDLIRDSLVENEWEEGDRIGVGIISLVYSHDVKELTDSLTHIQHRYFKEIISNLHIHIDEHTCLEVMVIKGKITKIKEVADRLIGTRGVIHGKLTLTTTGKDLF